MLHSHLHGRAKDLCKNILFVVIESEKGVERICKAVRKPDAISIASNTYQDFLYFLSTKRGQTENYRNYEVQFAAAIAKFNSNANSALTEFLS